MEQRLALLLGKVHNRAILLLQERPKFAGPRILLLKFGDPRICLLRFSSATLALGSFC